jgi:hypothetical protein
MVSDELKLVLLLQSKEGYMGSAKKKRHHAPTVRDRNILNLYNKLHEIVALLAELLHMQLMTDTTVLHLSTLGNLLLSCIPCCHMSKLCSSVPTVTYVLSWKLPP